MNGDAVLCILKLVGGAVNVVKRYAVIVVGDLEAVAELVGRIDDALYNNVLVGNLIVTLAKLEVNLFANLLALGYDLLAEVVIAESDLLISNGSLLVALLGV